MKGGAMAPKSVKKREAEVCLSAEKMTEDVQIQGVGAARILEHDATARRRHPLVNARDSWIVGADFLALHKRPLLQPH
jgi:hypothetical protein